MLVARRDPIPVHGTQEAPPSAAPGGGHPAPKPTGFARFIAGVQILATMLAIPVGLASGYSIYRANFSPEATCGSLRANIVSLLDKKADASTLRLLVRRDVATFERSCASVDPDAVAAFKTLLIEPVPVAAAAPKATKSESPERGVSASQPDSGKRLAARTTVDKGTAVRARPVRTTVARTIHADSDADWLLEVRRALVKQAPAPVEAAVPPAVRPMAQPLPIHTQIAPPLPPTTSVGVAPASRADDDHPVPPAPIPNVGPQ